MKLNKERLSTVGYFIKEGAKIVLPALGYAIFSQRGKLADMFEELRYSGNVTYEDAVKVIMDSDMMSSYKTEMVKILKRGETSDYYRAVIHTVKSDMMSSYKITVVSDMNEKEDQA